MQPGERNQKLNRTGKPGSAGENDKWLSLKFTTECKSWKTQPARPATVHFARVFF